MNSTPLHNCSLKNKMCHEKSCHHVSNAYVDTIRSSRFLMTVNVKYSSRGLTSSSSPTSSVVSVAFTGPSLAATDQSSKLCASLFEIGSTSTMYNNNYMSIMYQILSLSVDTFFFLSFDQDYALSPST